MHAYYFAFRMFYKGPYSLKSELRAPITYAPIINRRVTPSLNHRDLYRTYGTQNCKHALKLLFEQCYYAENMAVAIHRY